MSSFRKEDIVLAYIFRLLLVNWSIFATVTVQVGRQSVKKSRTAIHFHMNSSLPPSCLMRYGWLFLTVWKSFRIHRNAKVTPSFKVIEYSWRPKSITRGRAYVMLCAVFFPPASQLRWVKCCTSSLTQPDRPSGSWASLLHRSCCPDCSVWWGSRLWEECLSSKCLLFQNDGGHCGLRNLSMHQILSYFVALRWSAPRYNPVCGLWRQPWHEILEVIELAAPLMAKFYILC